MFALQTQGPEFDAPRNHVDKQTKLSQAWWCSYNLSSGRWSLVDSLGLVASLAYLMCYRPVRDPLSRIKKKKRPKAPEGWQLRLSSDPYTCGHVHLYYTCTHVNTHRGKGKTERDGRGERNCMWDSEFPISMKFLFFLIFIYSTIHLNHSLSFLHSSQFPPPIPTSTPLLSSPRREQTSQDISWTQHKVE